MKAPWAAATAGLLLLSASTFAGEIGFVEDFSLATDRSLPLQQLVPGTEDYYYYHCLNFQNTEQFAKVDELLRIWIERYQHTPRVLEIQNRQALLTYTKAPGNALKLIQNRLNLQFNHQRELLNQKPNLPTALDQKLIGRDVLNRRAFERHTHSVQGFEDRGLESLAQVELTPDQRRHWLSRLTRPDLPNLPQLIAADLRTPNSGGFGQFTIHQQLLRDQLDELVKLIPDLLNQPNFVNAYLVRLYPTDDENWRQDPKRLGEYLDRLWTFVQKLAPAHNSLKAHVLYHRLVFDRAQGVYDLERFRTYLQLPRHQWYVAAKLLERAESRQWPVNLHMDYAPQTQLAPIGDDEPLVRSYLLHFFVKADSYRTFEDVLNSDYLKHLFAETKLLNGLGDPEQWFSLLPPASVQALKERVDLEFDFANRTRYRPDDPVALDVDVKNVETLIVKVFELNAFNYYRENLKEVGTDISLDGLVANSEQTLKYAEPPLRRVRRHFEFPQLNRRGVYVIDFIGNGKSSRALVQKGQLRYLVRSGAPGHVFTILDEQNQQVRNATLWMAGTLHAPGKDGTIVTPYSNSPGKQSIILSVDGFSYLQSFEQASEAYELKAGIYIDREQLLQREKAKLILRPQLLLNGTPISLSLLEQVRLTITSRDLEGVSSTKDVADFPLAEDRDSMYEFLVPQRLSQLTVQLSARVKTLSEGKHIELSTNRQFGINEFDRTERIEDLHFVRLTDGYAVDVLGKMGESQPDRPVHFKVKLFDYRDPVEVSLQSDAKGRVSLGLLAGVDHVTATGPQGVEHTWSLPTDQHDYPASLNGEAGRVLSVPYMGRAKEPQRSEVSLLEVRGETTVSDRFEALAIREGFLELRNLPAGDYSLLLKPQRALIRVRLTAGPARHDYVLGDYRRLQQLNPSPLQIEVPEVRDDMVRVQLRNSSDGARVHLFATRFEPAFDAFAHLSRIKNPEPIRMFSPRVESRHVSGRNIGDEYRYILDRRYRPRFPGNMLERPSLLLNPWAVRSTETGEQLAQGGEAFQPAPAADMAWAAQDQIEQAVPPTIDADPCNLDFLARTSVVQWNLAPDDKGVVEIPRDVLRDRHNLLIVAVDLRNTVTRHVVLPEPEADYRDLRLAESLNAETHFTQHKRVSILKANEKLVLSDISSGRFEVYDSLAKVYSVYGTLQGDATWVEFGFLVQWSKLKPEEKRQKYSKFACHELHMFLLKKDPEFFRDVVRPYLQHKKDKTFLDQWLLQADLQSGLRPWDHAQLNTFERILLGRRIPGERPVTARLIHESWELLPPDLQTVDRLLETALQGSALEAKDDFGVAQAREKLPALRQLEEAERLGARAAGPAGAPAPPGRPAATTAAPESNAPVDGLKREYAGLKKAQAKSEAAVKEKDAEESLSFRRRGLARRDEFRKQLADDRARFTEAQQYYVKLDKTQEWAENNYYHLPIEQWTPELIAVNGFWDDYAAADPDQPFYSKHLLEPVHNLHEMAMALAVLDLPFEALEHKSEYEGRQLTLTAGSPLIVVHEEIEPAREVAKDTPILVSENFFRRDDRYRYVNNEQRDKFIQDEFLVDTVYGAQVVVTNPTSSRRRLNALLQVPLGSIPVLGGFYTRSVAIDLEPYHTQTLDYYFYFPKAGAFAHYPVQVASEGSVLAFANSFLFKVVNEPTHVDTESWEYVSQQGTKDEVLDYLRKHNLFRIDLGKIAFRMADRDFFLSVTALLTSRHHYHQVLWSYGVKHNDPPTIRQFLQFEAAFVAQCGDLLDSPLLTIDPVARKAYQHLDYRPLVNARCGPLGRRRQILNNRFFDQYHQMLKVLSYERQLDDDDLMAVTYYLLLQDRVGEALDTFGRVNADRLQTRLQYDYCAAYLDFYKEQPEPARQIAAKYADFPVDRWRQAFASISSQVDEIAKPATRVVDPEDRNQVQTGLAAATPSFDFVVEGRQVRLDYQNLSRVQVNYYLMDVELLFSRNPFVQEQSGQFSYITPNLTQHLDLPEQQHSQQLAIPERLIRNNVLIEIVGGGEVKSRGYYANALALQVIENYGQVRVTQAGEAKPLSKVYVKVYARMKDGSINFYKDGYTDLRGRFDYSSLNTNELGFVDRFALLVLSNEHGALVREAPPPKQ